MSQNSQSYNVTRWGLGDNVKEIESKVSQWQKKAQQLGVPEPRIRFTGNEKIVQLPVYDLAEFDAVSPLMAGATETHHVPALKKEVVFSGEIPKLEGYQLLAKIEHSKQEDGTYTNLVFSPNTDAEKRLSSHSTNYHVCTPDCNHCDSSRDRKTTFVVEDREAGSLLQLGSTCIDDFVGKKTLKQIMASFDAYQFFFNSDPWDEMDISYARGYNQLRHVSVATLLELADFYTSSQGFVRSGEMGATKDHMLGALSLDRNEPAAALSIVRQGVSGDNEQTVNERVQSILAWTQELENPDGNNYINNIKGICQRPFADINQRGLLGIVASIPTAYQRYQAKAKLERKNREVVNEPFGTVKARGPLKLTLTKAQNKTYGPHEYTTYSFRDDFGRAFSWKASGGSSEMASINVGDTVELDATIKDHSYFEANKTHYTHLKICKNIVKVPEDSPVPDFEAGAKKRPFKEQFSFTPSYLDESGENLGAGFMLVERTWRENSKIRSIKDVIPLNYTEGFEGHLVSLLMTAGVTRDPSDPYAEKKDQKFLAAAREAMRPYLELSAPQSNVLYMVDSAFPPMFSGDPYHEGPAHGSVTDKVKSMPRLFFDEEQAVAHGRTLPAGRILKIKIPDWDPAVVPTSLLLSSEEEVARFKSQAKVDNNAIVMIDDAGLVKRIEPLGMSSDWFDKGYEILRMYAAHAEPNESIASQSPRRLRGRQFATITGLERDPELSQSLKSYISDERNKALFTQSGLIPDTFSPAMMKGSERAKNTASSLQFLVSDAPLETNRGRLLAVTDSVTRYYLDLFGSDNLNIHIVTPNTISKPGPLSESMTVEAPEDVSVEALVEMINNKLGELAVNQDHHLRRARAG